VSITPDDEEMDDQEFARDFISPRSEKRAMRLKAQDAKKPSV
jgi:hypothetical protein